MTYSSFYPTKICFRPLKSLPVRQKTGAVFQHPDIPILDMEELVREVSFKKVAASLFCQVLEPN